MNCTGIPNLNLANNRLGLNLKKTFTQKEGQEQMTVGFFLEKFKITTKASKKANLE